MVNHPDCPDGVAAIEVARFLVKQLMLTIRARASWFPLHQARLLVAVSPRLARLPRFASSFREAFVAAAEEVLGAGERLVFAEEPFLAATARVMADLKARPLEGGEGPRLLDDGLWPRHDRVAGRGRANLIGRIAHPRPSFSAGSPARHADG